MAWDIDMCKNEPHNGINPPYVAHFARMSAVLVIEI